MLDASDRPNPADPADPAGHGGGVGSVADETARLLDALLGPAATPAEPPSEGAPSADAPSPEPCPTCGHTDGGPARNHRAAEVCHLCPVCQVLRIVRSVRPETLDRLADLASAVTETLRDAAAERWRTAGASDDGAPAAARPQVQDIVVGHDDGGLLDSLEPLEPHEHDDPTETQDREDAR